MTAKTRSALKAVFEQGDTPQGTDYENLIDSSVNLVDTTAQSLASPLSVTGALGASTTVSAQSVEASSASVTGAVSANSVHASAATFTSLIVESTARVSGNLFVSGDVTANSINVSAAVIGFLNVTTLATALATASAIGGSVSTVPTTAAGYITVQVCGATVAIPYFPVA